VSSIEELVRKVADRLELNENNLRKFLNEAFKEVSERYNLCRDFQSRAIRFGQTFEACFKIIMEKFFPDINLKSHVPLPEACMTGGGGVDFAVIVTDKNGDKKLVAVIEAKGSADHIICNGKRIDLPRPGMLRTDTVKKAICNAYLISRIYKNEVLFFIVTSHKPTEGDAKCMCDLAEGDVVTKIVDITNYTELEEMVKMIRRKLQEFG